MKENIIHRLENTAKKIRKNVITIIYDAGSGHPGGSLSCVDIITALYFHIMKHDPKNPKWKDRDRLILSKGHAAPALYVTLAESGYFPIEELRTLRKLNSRLQGHPDSHRLPGIEISSGSLGQGLSIGSGIALSAKLDKKDFKVYVILGDGETNEGQIWEAATFASHYKLDNLVAIIDRNHYQIDGPTEKIMSLEPFEEKWRSFGWNTFEINGNKMEDIINIFDHILNNILKNNNTNKPTVIIANTIKGKGGSIMEGNNDFHGRSPNKEEMDIILKNF